MKKIMIMAKVTVVIPTYKRHDLLKRAIDSVLAQTYGNIELIVVDDAGDDNVEKICEDYKDKYNLFLLKNKYLKGACGARNTGIEYATGEYIANLDDDDEYCPEFIKTMLTVYEKKYSFVTSNQVMCSNEEECVVFKNKKLINLNNVLYGNCVGSVIFTELYKIKAVCGYDLSLTSSQDYDLSVRLIERYGDALRIESVLYRVYVDHGGERITTSKNKIRGMLLFYKKHKHKMTMYQNVLFLLKILLYYIKQWKIV